MDYASITAQIVLIVGALCVWTNVITEVIKKVFNLEGKKAINPVAAIIGIAFTVAAMVAYCEMNGYVIRWYYILAFVVIGFGTAYAAIFGYDNFLSKLGKKDEK